MDWKEASCRLIYFLTNTIILYNGLSYPSLSKYYMIFYEKCFLLSTQLTLYISSIFSPSCFFHKLVSGMTNDEKTNLILNEVIYSVLVLRLKKRTVEKGNYVNKVAYMLLLISLYEKWKKKRWNTLASRARKLIFLLKCYLFAYLTKRVRNVQPPILLHKRHINSSFGW